jgi:hypothetical protein
MAFTVTLKPHIIDFPTLVQGNSTCFIALLAVRAASFVLKRRNKRRKEKKKSIEEHGSRAVHGQDPV